MYQSIVPQPLGPLVQSPLNHIVPFDIPTEKGEILKGLICPRQNNSIKSGGMCVRQIGVPVSRAQFAELQILLSSPALSRSSPFNSFWGRAHI